MDRNTTKYMIDELKRKAEEAEQRAEQRVQEEKQKAEKLLIGKVCRKLQKGKDDIAIADELEEEINDICRITAVVRNMDPDYDVEKIYTKLNASEEPAKPKV